MAASLRELLSKERSHLYSNGSKSTSFPSPCADHRNFDLYARRRSFANLHSEPTNSKSRSTAANAANYDDDSTDKTALCAVVSVLSGYAGRFLKNADFRRRLRNKCAACIATARKGTTHAMLANLELGIDNIERLAEKDQASLGGGTRDSKIRFLRNSIRLLSVVASLNSPRSLARLYTCGVPNADLSSCAQLYLAVAYKIERNDRLSAKHLLQVFVDAPYLARNKLLPDLWDLFLLPHLLHLKVWHTKEVELVASWDVEERDRRMKGLNRAYNDQMDAGTAQFAVYYRDWIKFGGEAPPIPTVSLPRKPSYLKPWGKRSMPLSLGSINKNLKLVSETHFEDKSDSIKYGNFANVSPCGFSRHRDVSVKQRVQEHLIAGSESISGKSHSSKLFSCRSMPDAASVRHVQTPKKEFSVVARKRDNNHQSLNLGQAISLISESDDLKECETAIHIIAKGWRDSHGNVTLVTALSASSVIEGLLDVIFTSRDDNVLELSISILAVLVVRNDENRQVVLHADPQLESFLRLLRSKNLFLKAAVVLYLLRPKAKQMLSVDWIPLVLRVLDYGDTSQTLFTIKCHPKRAAFYLLDQLLMGFDMDRNVENSKQLAALGGLKLLMRILEIGDSHETNCAALLARCIRADGKCKEYLVENMNKASIVQLLCNQMKSNNSAITLLSDLVCLSRTTRIISFLNELKNVGYANAMHVLLVYLQQAPNEQRPLAAALLLQLDLLGDPLRHSVYRDDAIDALIAAMECNLHNRKIQEKCSSALLLLAGRFSCSGRATAESWLLRRAGLFGSRATLSGEIVRPEEEEKVTEEWLRKLAIILVTSGSKRLLVALSNCISDGIPILARSCLVTVAWMSSSLASWNNANHLRFLACSTLSPRLFQSLSYHKTQEERVLASLSLFNFVRCPECLPKLFPLEKETICSLQDLSQVTWTAKELLFASCR